MALRTPMCGEKISSTGGRFNSSSCHSWDTDGTVTRNTRQSFKAILNTTTAITYSYRGCYVLRPIGSCTTSLVLCLYCPRSVDFISSRRGRPIILGPAFREQTKDLCIFQEGLAKNLKALLKAVVMAESSEE